MNNTQESIKALIERNDVRISEHGYDELENDGLSVREIIEGSKDSVLIEDYPNYPNYPKGPSILVLQWDKIGNPVHVVWGIPKGHTHPAVLITAYLPDPQSWNSTFTAREK